MNLTDYGRTIAAALSLKRPLMVLDLETTGADPAADRILEIGVYRVQPDGTVSPWSTLVNPGRAIPAAATEVHGITDAMVADAPSFEEVAPGIAERVIGRGDLAGFNARAFDLRLLANELRRVGQAVAADCVEDAKVLDGYRLWQLLEPRRLADALARFAPDYVPDGDAHRALADAGAALAVIAGQLEAWRLAVASLGKLEGLDQLHAAQFPIAPDWVDAAGRIRLVNGEPTIAFGKHKGKALRLVPESYLRWMTDDHTSFPSSTKKVVEEHLRRTRGL